MAIEMTIKVNGLLFLLRRVNAFNDLAWDVTTTLRALNPDKEMREFMDKCIENISLEIEDMGVCVVKELHKEKMYQDFEPDEWFALVTMLRKNKEVK